MSLIHHVDAIAKRKINITGWEPYAWERIGTDAIKVTGGIPRPLKSGPRKGQKTWDGPSQVAVVVQAEVDDEIARYEEETGQCSECLGDGKVMHSYNCVKDEKTYRPCGRCTGTGARP